jgi:hypothetical protein|tara:strand:+ start:2235 stop:2564 length:330 start_codon:yes stop_codon:yes gene_type:complete
MLSNFNKITLMVSMTILIVVLALYGVVLYSSMQNSNYPAIKNDCPDYWDVSEGDGKMSCEIKHNINSGDFTAPADYIPKNDLCDDYKWAKKNNITWDGITNNSKIKDCL